ncbi:MAG: phosphodiester glycosidase family protein [Planctomycetes bacterium]|nr:phosphodiester glycosidase family protein [Planctomycetota bacterium]
MHQHARRRSALALALALGPGVAGAIAQQDVRELVLSPIGWQTHEVGVGVLLRQRWFPRLFTGPQSVTVLDVRLGPTVRFGLACAPRRATTSRLGEAAFALAAVNGGFFDIRGDGHALGLLRRDGVLLSGADAGQGCLGFAADGGVHVTARPAGDWPEVRDALGAGPMLLVDGAVVEHGERQAGIRHPRTAVAATADGRVLLVTVDGRTAMATGMSFVELATLLQALGGQQAVNLDGGGSTTLWRRGAGVCNFPCDNKRFDHQGERAVANAVLLFAPAVVVVDDDAADLIGDGWHPANDGHGWHGADFARATAAGARAVFAAELPFAGRYRVYAFAPVTAAAAPAWLPGGLDLAAAGAREVQASPGQWAWLGEVQTGADRRAAVTLAASGPGLCVDAVRFEQVQAAPGSSR